MNTVNMMAQNALMLTVSSIINKQYMSPGQ